MDDISNRLVRGKYFYLVENMQVVEPNPSILFWLALPMNHKGQKVNIHSINPVPAEIIEDTMNGNRIVFWKLAELNDIRNIQFDYEFDVLAEDVEHEIDLNEIEPYDTDSELYKFYTKSEPWIEITSGIAQKAKEIVGLERNPYLCAKLLFDWVVANMAYLYPDVNDRGAGKSFARLSGDCGEFSYVFIALCRSIGIPARSVTAVWSNESGHAWAEFYLEPYGWLPVDTNAAQAMNEEAQKKIKSKSIERDYLFGNLYPNRLIVCIGTNIVADAKTENITRTFSFLQPGGYCSYSCSIEFNGFSEKVIHAGFYLFDEEINDIDMFNARKDKEFAQSYFQIGDYDKAEKDLLNIVNHDNNALISWFYLGQVYLNKGKPEDAIRCFQNSINNEKAKLPEEALVWAYNLLGSCYLQTDRQAEAIESFRLVIDKGFDYQGALEYAGKLLEEANKTKP